MIAAIGFVLIYIAGLANSVMDKSAEGHLHYLSDWWRKSKSSWNKWKLTPNPRYFSHSGLTIPVENDKHLWYYLWLYKPRYKERFMYSSGPLVWVTDGWHFCKMIELSGLCVGILIVGWSSIKHDHYGEFISEIIAVRLVFGLGFWTGYNWILK